MEKNENRGYFRVEVRLPIEFRIINHDECLNLENAVKHGSAQIVDKINEMHFLKEIVSTDKKEKGQIYSYIKMIDKKLDIIIDLLNRSRDDGLYISRYINVNISGAGVRFTTDVNLNEGERVELRVILPFPPYPKITSLCEVVRSMAVKVNGIANWEIALTFATINEDDRDLLINFIFAKERELLRYRKEQAG
ncbi:MAG: PilZ domain-containing protein [Proteobacteria bacterium]|nr:PilZ domain-containing protein [Pseudomonadota bacterium]